MLSDRIYLSLSLCMQVMPSKQQTWKYVLDTELRNAGGMLHVKKLKDKMTRSYKSERRTTRNAHCLGLEALASIPDEYLSMVDSYVRLPPSDSEIARARAKLQWHCHQFEGRRDKHALIDRYSSRVNGWANDLEERSAEMMKHAVHVAAWLAFAADQEDDLLSRVGSLLVHMLRALKGIHLISRLRLALYHVADRLNDLDECEWVTNALTLVNSALGRLPSGGSLEGRNVTSSHVKPSRNPQRTDYALVRHVLGTRELPPGCRIFFKAASHRRKQRDEARWCGCVRGSRSNQFSANLKRFTERDAIEHVYRSLVAWHEYQIASAPQAEG
eukprot:TRINITY_DN22301_c0_g3_i1.p1 TRINITY_DN22301_c0_g3~~TRINITY_DN22301_c0_g3_i1.p1  ORF type:complete len:329 (+),score=16.51 TRINITY_DN22301_c0_g3_i1:13-999(+)